MIIIVEFQLCSRFEHVIPEPFRSESHYHWSGTRATVPVCFAPESVASLDVVSFDYQAHVVVDNESDLVEESSD